MQLQMHKYNRKCNCKYKNATTNATANTTANGKCNQQQLKCCEDQIYIRLQEIFRSRGDYRKTCKHCSQYMQTEWI